MFFAIGITDRREDLEYDGGVMTCDSCGAYGRYQIFMVCTVLYLFFIPVWRWNKRYYVETSCCHTVYELDPSVGEAIAGGEQIEIRETDLNRIRKGQQYKKCIYCGYETAEDFDYCPKCGNRF